MIYNLSYHKDRFDNSRRVLFGIDDVLELSKYIDAPLVGLYRCRILYDSEIKSVEYIPYTPKEINSLYIVSSDVDYEFKYANRDEFNRILLACGEADEVIIEKDGYLTDTTISNIAFYDGEVWVTPQNPLLKGTMRAKLIEEGFLSTKNIQKDNLSQYSHLALINAMIGFKILNHFNIIDKT